MQSSESRVQNCGVSSSGVYRIDRVREFGRAGHGMQATSLQMGSKRFHAKISGTTCRKDIVQSKRAKVDKQSLQVTFPGQPSKQADSWSQ